MSDRFDAAGYGAIPVGFGDSPAVLVVDFQRAFTDPSLPAGGSPHIHAAVRRTATLLAAARRAGILVVSCRTAWCGARDVIPWKTAAVRTGLFHGDPGTELDPRIHDPAYDVTLVKAGPSIFFGTPVAAILQRNRVDTVVVAGCTTSGCVRASIIDAFSHGLRTIVPADCCGDMEPGPHEANLLDVGRRYADVVDAEACMARFAASGRIP
ncbi:Maleamate amidohydrolase [Methylobacterium crusticola]|uniref:Maleamate amidohydrolase n=1 Tax=Methylobacterium crusticola TaxID=1697972 RepID=A0ABQ4R5A9_9HYPH|nr:isochorismatase family protein [Methylobacterium crusticola]GJD52135.1 Maleamate amidohydrolase [Methylobacterium crusticola]